MDMKYKIDQEKCTFCGGCATVCPVMAIDVTDNSCIINYNCISCSLCEKFCPIAAVEVKDEV